jgi:prevent-host-death family protein
MRHISQRELRNDNAEVMRLVESGESFVVTRNGTPVAQLVPLPERDAAPGLPISQEARRRVDYTTWPRVRASVSSETILADLRDER